MFFVKRDVLTDAHCMWCRLAFQRALAKIEVVGRFCRRETNKVFGSGSISCDGAKECVSLFAREGGHCFAQVRRRRPSQLYVAGQMARDAATAASHGSSCAEARELRTLCIGRVEDLLYAYPGESREEGLLRARGLPFDA